MRNVLNLPLLCDEKGVPYLPSGHHHCHEGWIQIHCPFCTDGTHDWHMGFNLERGNFNCWRCGSKSVWNTLAEILPAKDRRNLKQIIRQYSTSPALTEKKTVRKRSVKKPPLLEPLHKIHKEYLRGRGFNPSKLEKVWGLQGTRGYSDEWSYRVVAPIKNLDGEIVAYTGRALKEGKKPKWKTSHTEEMGQDPRTLLYGIEKVSNQVLIVEGPADAWRMGPGAVALLGMDWKEEQANRIRRYEKRFILFDPSPHARQRANGLAEWLAAFPGDTEIINGLGPYDPGAMPQRMADEVMKELGF